MFDPILSSPELEHRYWPSGELLSCSPFTYSDSEAGFFTTARWTQRPGEAMVLLSTAVRLPGAQPSRVPPPMQKTKRPSSLFRSLHPSRFGAPTDDISSSMDISPTEDEAALLPRGLARPSSFTQTAR